MNLSLPKPCSDSLSDTLQRFISEGRTAFYLEDLVKESNVPLHSAETFLIPLLKKDKLEGKLEVRCPRCRRDQGFFDRVTNIPSEFVCDICGYEFPMQREDLQIILEVKGDFFPAQESAKQIEIKYVPTKQELIYRLRASLQQGITAKGPEFEHFFESFMKREQNFQFAFKHPRTANGEIDYIYTHELESAFWRVSPYICIECKNWKDNISSVEMGHLGNLVAEKYPLSCLGVYLTTSAYDPSAYETIKQFRNMNRIILIPVEGKHLEEMIDRGFEDFIKEVCEYTVFKRKKS